MRLRPLHLVVALAAITTATAILSSTTGFGPNRRAGAAASARTDSSADPSQAARGLRRYRAGALEPGAGDIASSLARLRALLEAADAGGATIDERETQAYRELERLLAQDPGALAAIEAELREIDEQSAFSRLALAALAGTGNPDAQAALLRLVDARAGDATFVRQGVAVMGFAKHPSPALVDGLRRLHDDGASAEVRDMALLAMGGAAARLRENPERAAAIVSELGTGLADAGDLNARASHLGALGNVGSPAAIAAILPYAAAEDPRVRAKAMTALRLAPTGAIDETLARALTSDPSAAVRRAAAWALARRPATEGGVAALRQALAAERDSDAASAMLDALARAHHAFPGLVDAALAEAASHPLEGVRTRAAKLAAA